MVAKKTLCNTTDIFEGKIIPSFLQNNSLFDKTYAGKNPVPPTKIEKVFPTIGLSNFKFETNIPQSMSEIKKEGSYVWYMLLDISSECLKLKDLVSLQSQKTQFLAPIEERRANKAKLNEIAQLVVELTAVQESCDPRSAVAFHPTNGVVCIGSEKINLRLHAPILNAEGKITYKAGVPIFRVYNQLLDKCIDLGLSRNGIKPLESLPSYKVFSAENIPNKKLNIVFSSDGKEGAWDIMTMSMRGIRSCQRWDGEYPRCLIGSVLSKFVGIIYLTAGSKSDPYGDYDNLGPKMMRRSVVRYAFDKSIGKPCLIVDKMYPSDEEGIIKLFIDVLAEKSKLPVYYAPRLANKTKHIYLPNEKMKNFSFREKSYQDTAIRTKSEIDSQLISNHYTECGKQKIRMQYKLSSYLLDRFNKINSSFVSESNTSLFNLKKIVGDLAISTPLSLITEVIAQTILDLNNVAFNNVESYSDLNSFRKAYLKFLFKNRKDLMNKAESSIKDILVVNCSLNFDCYEFYLELSKLFLEFIKVEYMNVIRDR